jgi:hypothetical protein
MKGIYLLGIVEAEKSFKDHVKCNSIKSNKPYTK